MLRVLGRINFDVCHIALMLIVVNPLRFSVLGDSGVWFALVRNLFNIGFIVVLFIGIH